MAIAFRPETIAQAGFSLEPTEAWDDTPRSSAEVRERMRSIFLEGRARVRAEF
jgi:hypothetical protein